jgi:hypothetical protein
VLPFLLLCFCCCVFVAVFLLLCFCCCVFVAVFLLLRNSLSDFVFQIGTMDRKLKSLMKQQTRIETTRFHASSGAAGGTSRSASPTLTASATTRPSGKH